MKTGIFAADGKLQPSFDPTRTGFTLQLPEAYGNAEINVPPQEPIKKSGRNFFAQLATRQAIEFMRRSADLGQRRWRCGVSTPLRTTPEKRREIAS